MYTVPVEHSTRQPQNKITTITSREISSQIPIKNNDVNDFTRHYTRYTTALLYISLELYSHVFTIYKER